MIYKKGPFVWNDTSDKKTRKIMEQLIHQKIAENLRPFSHTASSGKIYQLSPDNMPCLVPVSSLTKAMPNGYRDNPAEKQSIPNPLYPGKKQN